MMGPNVNWGSFVKLKFDHDVERLLSEINSFYYKMPGEYFSLEWLKYYVSIASIYSEYFIGQLKHTSVKAVFLTCYYTPHNMGLIHACKKLGILTTDLQHGHQSADHAMYSQWSREPIDGYELLPSIMWKWNGDVHNHKNICDNINKKMISIVGGNQLISFYLYRIFLFHPSFLVFFYILFQV